ncbi:MAG: DUF2249 domain-containing protein [Chitinivorax sp.]
MSNTRNLDVCGLQPPEPFERIMEALDDLPDGDVLEVRIHRQPHPLYEVLRNHGYVFTTDPTPDGVFLIRIRKA